MGYRIIGAALIALVLTASTKPALAAGEGAAAVHATASQAQATPKKARPVAASKLVDINSASREQLKTLPGIGAAQADKIVAGRPYLSKADIVSTHAIPAGVYLSIKDKIIARQDLKRPLAGKGRP